MQQNPLIIPNLDKLFKKHDIILAKPNIYQHNLYTDYCFCHIIEDYLILENVIKELYPEYYNSFQFVMRKSNRLSHYNMFIVRRNIFEDYSKWLFEILFEVQKRVKISPYASQARIFGYMSERLLNVYVHHNKLRVKYTPVLKVCNEQNNSWYINFMKAVKYNLTFYIDNIYRK